MNVLSSLASYLPSSSEEQQNTPGAAEKSMHDKHQGRLISFLNPMHMPYHALHDFMAEPDVMKGLTMEDIIMQLSDQVKYLEELRNMEDPSQSLMQRAVHKKREYI